MAAVVLSAVTVLNKWTGFGPTAKFDPYNSGRTITFYQVSVVLSTQGGATNFLAANLIGNLGVALGASPAVYSDNSAIVPISPSADGTKVLVGGGASNAPQDISATVLFVVWGFDNLSPTVTGSTDGDQS